jgi:hypothetical protein
MRNRYSRGGMTIETDFTAEEKSMIDKAVAEYEKDKSLGVPLEEALKMLKS